MSHVSSQVISAARTAPPLGRASEALAGRLLAMRAGGWDINVLARLHDDAGAVLAEADRDGHEALATLARETRDRLAEVLQRTSLPDPPSAAALAELALQLIDASTALTLSQPVAAFARGNPGRAETPPPDYWRRWPAAPPGADALPCVVPPVHGPGAAMTTPPIVDPPSGAPPQPANPPGPHRRIYHLTDSGTLACELDQRLEAEGFEVELLNTTDELIEILGALPPDLVLVDSTFLDDLTRIGAPLQTARQRSGTRLALIAIADAANMPLRLTAHRAGADLLIVNPQDAEAVLAQLRQVLMPPPEPPYRVLIVEDDRSQGVFAESILRNAGMEARVVEDPLAVLDTLREFKPDLILMDLYMPLCDGIELTALIREQPELLSIPIVFLSGEGDPDVQFDVIDAGADDFLAKPVRPRHLIAAVQNRIQRARAQESRRGVPHADHDERTGLLHRDALMAHLQRAVQTSIAGNRRGGLLFLEVEGAAQLRERLGLSALEQALTQAGQKLTAELAPDCIGARLGDASFLVVNTRADGPGLEARAAGLRALLMQQAFEIDGKPLRLRVSVGICPFSAGLGNAGAVLNAAERVCRDARSRERGIARYEAPKRPEMLIEAGVEASIRAAIAGQGFELIYQPIVAVQGGEQAQFQVLLRLRDNAGKVHSAAEVVPLAERLDLLVDVDRWVLGEAVAVLARKHREGGALRLFLTQSTLTMASTEQAEWLRTSLSEAGVPPESLVIEIRLDDAIVHAATVGEFCRDMVQHGVSFCLSQFEAGLESASLMGRLPLSFIKLAPRYQQAGATQSVKDELHQLIADAHRRGIKVIGHRVEDPQAAATLWMVGIDFLQGNLVQRAGDDLDFDFQSAVL
jgi:PleD family two-component response regulator/EAL domain-containing protein (putative c-di-GMP-specific phosphodiesterase class I)